MEAESLKVIQWMREESLSPPACRCMCSQSTTYAPPTWISVATISSSGKLNRSLPAALDDGCTD
jgi:hypothetical protein